MDLSLMAFSWFLIAANSFLRVSSVPRAPAKIQGRRLSTETLESIQSQIEAMMEIYPLSRPRGRQPCPWPSARRPPAASCAASTWACNLASWVVAASACTLAASHTRSIRACARSARDYINKQAKRPSDLARQSNLKQETQKD
jgi:hypothetical protein